MNSTGICGRHEVKVRETETVVYLRADKCELHYLYITIMGMLF